MVVVVVVVVVMVHKKKTILFCINYSDNIPLSLYIYITKPTQQEYIYIYPVIQLVAWS
ncbi:hypothetical protein LbFV_ORF16 [Leptopilina boulardi filamentous virus]|uniref:Uncharacterized protein n=1 Tax=Leptopilina boulardi filamentous virus TaxID=552509 RepID=A0A1S5YD57_9VIRU|nr:hypothetical protein LbFV_ORF16 [Leptopilina boulardi filamentous virus]AQQ79936.1 hypothetical protein LbFV_ORF16 [Leptopilina boulardi filamentous virus]